MVLPAHCSWALPAKKVTNAAVGMALKPMVKPPPELNLSSISMLMQTGPTTLGKATGLRALKVLPANAWRTDALTSSWSGSLPGFFSGATAVTFGGLTVVTIGVAAGVTFGAVSG